MDVWKYEIISRVEQDPNTDPIQYWSILEINFIFLHIHVLFSIYYIQIDKITMVTSSHLSMKIISSPLNI